MFEEKKHFYNDTLSIHVHDTCTFMLIKTIQRQRKYEILYRVEITTVRHWPSRAVLLVAKTTYAVLLGPLLFLLYIDDIKSVIQYAYCHFYADDTIILKGASDPDSLIASLESELSNGDH